MAEATDTPTHVQSQPTQPQPDAGKPVTDASDDRDRLIGELDLELLNVLHCDEGVKVMRYNWPKKNRGAAEDRTLAVFVWPSGTWLEAIDTGKRGVEDVLKEARRMVRV